MQTEHNQQYERGDDVGVRKAELTHHHKVLCKSLSDLAHAVSIRGESQNVQNKQ